MSEEIVIKREGFRKIADLPEGEFKDATLVNLAGKELVVVLLEDKLPIVIDPHTDELL